MHLCHYLTVNAAEEHTGQKAEQEAGENQDIAQILQGSQNCTHVSHLLKELSAGTQ